MDTTTITITQDQLAQVIRNTPLGHGLGGSPDQEETPGMSAGLARTLFGLLAGLQREPEPQPTRDALLAFARSVAAARPDEDAEPSSEDQEDLGMLADDADRLLSGQAQPALSALSDIERRGLWGGIKPASDGFVLDQIAEMLRDPEWGVGMLEDIRDLVNRTGRTCENYPDDRPTWGRH
jgi:hypothetical protein